MHGEWLYWPIVGSGGRLQHPRHLGDSSEHRLQAAADG